MTHITTPMGTDEHVSAPVTPEPRFDVIVIGGGQAGIAMGYYLNARSARFVILERAAKVGGCLAKSLGLPAPIHPGRLRRPSRDAVPARTASVPHPRPDGEVP